MKTDDTIPTVLSPAFALFPSRGDLEAMVAVIGYETLLAASGARELRYREGDKMVVWTPPRAG